MKRFLILIIPVLILAGCNNRNSIRITGTAKDTPGQQIYITRMDVDSPIKIDSSEIKKDGRFRFRIKATEPDFYQVGYSASEFVTLLASPGEDIRLEFGNARLSDDYTVSGSEGSSLVRELDLRLINTRNRLDSLSRIYEALADKPEFKEQGPLIEDEYREIVKDERLFSINFILNNLSSLATVKALYQKFNDDSYVFYQVRDLQYFKIATDSLKKYYHGSKHTLALEEFFKKGMDNFYARQLEQLTSSIPETKLDPDLTDIKGKRIALSSLKGKYVLLSFWSAGSKDCIAENLQLKEYYKIYKRKGFEIYQINLDQDEAQWKEAVRFDELPWINTREDDPLNPKNARLYNVKTLPANFLYDPEGNIIALNIHGRNLQIKLDQLFNNQ